MNAFDMAIESVANSLRLLAKRKGKPYFGMAVAQCSTIVGNLGIGNVTLVTAFNPDVEAVEEMIRQLESIKAVLEEAEMPNPMGEEPLGDSTGDSNQ